MAVNHHRYVGRLLVILMCIGLLGTPFSVRAQEVHALLVLQGADPGIRASVAKSKNLMQQLMEQVSQHCSVRLTVMHADDSLLSTVSSMTLSKGEPAHISEKRTGSIRERDVNRWLTDVSPTSADTVLVYYNGHGSMEANEHLLNFAENDVVSRADLRARLAQKPARLKMLITDTCSTLVDTPEVVAASTTYANVIGKGHRYTQHLFLEHEGMLDITAAERGDYAWGHKDIGGFFTAALIHSIQSCGEKADVSPKDTFLTWDEVFAQCITETQHIFTQTLAKSEFGPEDLLQNDKRKPQTPVAYAPLPQRLAHYAEPRTRTPKPEETTPQHPQDRITCEKDGVEELRAELDDQQEGSLPATEESKAGEPSTGTVRELLREAELDEALRAEFDDAMEKLRAVLNEGDYRQKLLTEPVKLNLWTFTNGMASFRVSLAISETDLVVGDEVTLEMHISTDAHLVLLNWDGAGELWQLIPNDFQPTSLWKAGQHSFPGGDADFEIRVDTPGTERFKLLAFQNAEDSRAVANIFQTGAQLELPQLPPELQNSRAEEKIWEYLQSMNPTDWAEAQLEVSVREPERPVPARELLDVNAENIVYIKHGGDMYLARRLETRYGEAGSTVVHIFNAELRDELGDTIAAELVLGRRTEPAQGWGNRRVMLSFYRDGEWSFTTDVVVFETYYELPERIDGKRVRDSRIVGFGEVRFPIPVSFQ